MIKELLFGTAGIPLSAKGTTVDAIGHVRKLGLDAMELEFVRGIYVKKDKAPAIRIAAKKHKIVLSCHAPYFINLNTSEKKKLYASYGYIVNSAVIGSLCGAFSMTFHAGYYMKQDPGKVYTAIKKHLKEIVKKVHNEGHKIDIRPEVMGKVSSFGSFDEVLNLSAEINGILPCIDFAHLHARDGKNNTYTEFTNILGRVEKKLGKQGLRNMHIHMSGINYGEKGEKNHLILKDSDMNYKDLMKALKKFRCKGVVICESPSIEKDALLMQKTYKNIRI